MPFSTYCNHKGCGDYMEPYIDQANDKVYCSKCDNEITNLTHFAKTQMKSFKQFKPKKKLAFSVRCNNCSKEDCPKLLNNQIICPNCQKPITNLSEPFKLILKEKLKNKDQDI